MGDRFLVGYPLDGRWHRPAMDVVALYVDQKPEGDQSAARAGEFGFKVYPTIAETLRCGTDKLAVDGVLVIGEHGDYPSNAKGQIQYPRYEFFEQIVKVFEKDGRSVPVFNDKHLSYSFEKASKMVAAAKRLKFPLLAGSSLPVTLAAAQHRAAAGLHDRRGADGRRRRVGRDGFSCAGGDAVHARTAPQRRDGRESGAVD